MRQDWSVEKESDPDTKTGPAMCDRLAKLRQLAASGTQSLLYTSQNLPTGGVLGPQAPERSSFVLRPAALSLPPKTVDVWILKISSNVCLGTMLRFFLLLPLPTAALRCDAVRGIRLLRLLRKEGRQGKPPGQRLRSWHATLISQSTTHYCVRK